MKKILITGSGGLVGSEAAEHFCSAGFKVYGIDNNSRMKFFGKEGDTTERQNQLKSRFPAYINFEADLRDRTLISKLINEIKPFAIIHAAAQPSHDYAAAIPFIDFDINAVGTLNLLEAVRQSSPDTIFIFLSTNKVYGDRPNKLALIETEKRYEFSGAEYTNGIDESFQIDQSKHSLFGSSKLAADILVQEYGRYFGMQSCVLRAGCITGPNHAGVKLHGFLNYLVKCNVFKTEYTIFGYKGKQVRDNIHSKDLVRFFDYFIKNPGIAEVFNIGGGKENSISIIEAIELINSISENDMIWKLSDEPRSGDHICYYTNLTKISNRFPEWKQDYNLEKMISEIYIHWSEVKSQI